MNDRVATGRKAGGNVAFRQRAGNDLQPRARLDPRGFRRVPDVQRYGPGRIQTVKQMGRDETSASRYENALNGAPEYSLWS